jgi:predicted acylesterase/phospholipase RssA
VRVELASGERRILLVAPDSFGEMSALTGEPVSATVIADRESVLWTIAAPALLDVLADEAAFFRNVAGLLGMRLRERTRRRGSGSPRCVLLGVRSGARDADRALLAALGNGLLHRAPGSRTIDLSAADAGPSHQAPGASSDPVTAAAECLRAWRATGTAEAVLLLGVDAGLAPGLVDALADGDAHLVAADDPASDALPEGAAVPIHWRDAARARRPGFDRWAHALPPDEIAAAAGGGAWAATAMPALDRLVRRLAGLEVGIAMSVGAAAGLAHLGVLEVLEDEGLPVDFLCGSSMGGAVALAVAHAGSARAATADVLRLVADFARRKGILTLPRGSFVSAARMRTLTHALFGGATFADLSRPVAVVAADLAMGRRVVLDRGPVAEVARATAAIPGIFAPVRLGDALLVDGAVVSRLPVDLLAARGCGVRLAVMTRPTYPDAPAEAARAADRLEARLARPFGLRAAMGGAWRLQGWWDSAGQAGRADCSLTVPIPVGEGFNFRAAAAMVECGRRTARDHLPQLRAAVARAL